MKFTQASERGMVYVIKDFSLRRNNKTVTRAYPESNLPDKRKIEKLGLGTLAKLRLRMIVIY